MTFYIQFRLPAGVPLKNLASTRPSAKSSNVSSTHVLSTAADERNGNYNQTPQQRSQNPPETRLSYHCEFHTGVPSVNLVSSGLESPNRRVSEWWLAGSQLLNKRAQRRFLPMAPWKQSCCLTCHTGSPPGGASLKSSTFSHHKAVASNWDSWWAEPTN